MFSSKTSEINTVEVANYIVSLFKEAYPSHKFETRYVAKRWEAVDETGLVAAYFFSDNSWKMATNDGIVGLSLLDHDTALEDIRNNNQYGV